MDTGETLNLSVAIFRPREVRYLLISFFPCYCDQMPDKKQLGSRKVCFDTQFESSVSVGKKLKLAGKLGSWSHCLQ